MMKYSFQNKLNIKVSVNEDVFYDEDTNTIYIPLKKKDVLLELIKNYRYANLIIKSSCLIDKDVLFAIRNNQNLFSITLGCSEDVYVLTRNDFLLLNESESLFNINTEAVEGKYSFSEMEYLTYFRKNVVGFYKIADFYTSSIFHFHTSLSDEEIKRVSKYINNNSRIFFDYDNLDNIIKVIEALKGRNIEFNLPLFKDNSFYLEQFKDVMDENIYIQGMMDLKQYLYLDSYLESMVKDIKSSSLSSFESYLAIYTIVTHYKNYLENHLVLNDARKLEYILFNDYIVCEGFCVLAEALLNKLGIPAVRVGVEVYKEKEEVSLEEQYYLNREQIKNKEGNVGYHTRIMVNMNDDKYDIHGIYMADATWDNDLEHHYFNHALLTFYEVGLENVSFYENDLCIFDVQNSEEFLEKIDKHPSAISTFIRIIKQIDKIYYEHLDKMYDLDGSNRKMLLDIYHYILLHTKNRVSSEKFMDAFKVLFPFIYKMDDKKINEYIIKIGEENKRRDSLFFKGGR